ncbi:MAG TPA: HlyD family efflux transporter periplasmic adaptor subunit, partial [Polyangiaceae bacterium]
MDVKRQRPKRNFRSVLWALVGVLVLGGLATAMLRAKPRPVAVKRAALWTGRVEKSPFVVRVKGAGTLLPEAVRWLTAETSGRVEEVFLKPGANVDNDTAIVRLENLDVRLLAVQADREVASGHSDLMALERSVHEDELSRESDSVTLHTTLSEAERRADAYAQSPGTVVSVLDTKHASEQAAELERRSDLADKKLDVVRKSAPAQIGALRTQIQARQEMSRVRHEVVDRLVVRAGAKGTLSDVLVELGQWVVPGTNVAKVIVSDRLKAELRIPEEQAGGVSIGQVATIDTRSGTITGHVRRVASEASHGTVRVEIALDGDMPKGARPDQSIDGYVEIEHTDETLHMPRPMNAQPNSTVSLFRIDPKTGVATRVQVRTGRASVDALEIVSGLDAGDEVILSDTSSHANA